MLTLMACRASERVDLLASGLGATKAGVRFAEEIEARLGVSFAASDDVSGNPASGGKRVLVESTGPDDVDVKSLYFDLDKMAAFAGCFLEKQQRRAKDRVAKIARVEALKGDFGNVSDKTKALESEIRMQESSIRIRRRRDEWAARKAKEVRDIKYPGGPPATGAGLIAAKLCTVMMN
jgi:hypothetical protein